LWLTGGSSSNSRKKALWQLLFFVPVIAAYIALRVSVLGRFGIPVAAQYMSGRLTYFERLWTAGRVFIKYLVLIFYPVNVAGDYDYNAVPIAGPLNSDAWLGLLLTVAIALWALWYRRRNSVVSLGVLFAFVAFAPASNWVLPISVLMAERFLYLPLIGISIALAFAFNAIQDPRIRKLIAVGGLVWAIVLCNGHDYVRRNAFSFFANMVQVTPNSAKARLGYGYALLQAGRKDEAAVQLEAGLRIIPDYPELLSTLALTKASANNCNEAWPLLIRANQIDPKHADTHRRMGDCYLVEGKMKEAEAMYHMAIDSIPYPDAALFINWARALEAIGQKQSAFSAYQRAAALDPANERVKAKLRELGS
jgi:tetratricopeptide (TPR) repeat protein